MNAEPNLQPAYFDIRKKSYIYDENYPSKYAIDIALIRCDIVTPNGISEQWQGFMQNIDIMTLDEIQAMNREVTNPNMRTRHVVYGSCNRRGEVVYEGRGKSVGIRTKFELSKRLAFIKSSEVSDQFCEGK